MIYELRKTGTISSDDGFDLIDRERCENGRELDLSSIADREGTSWDGTRIM